MKHDGRFGAYGGCFVPEILVPALEQLEHAECVWIHVTVCNRG